MESYESLASRTEAPLTAEMRLKGAAPRNLRLLHAAIGLCTEAGEFQDQLKRHIYYNSKLDEVNLIEELGDLMWYVALACNVLGMSLEEVQEINIAKLKQRFPHKFLNTDAQERDLEKEREVLEQGPPPATQFIDLLTCTECKREEYYRQGSALPDDWVQWDGVTLCPHCNYKDHDENDENDVSDGPAIRISLDRADFRTLVRGKVLECTLDSKTVQLPLQIVLKDIGYGPMLETIEDARREQRESKRKD